MPSQPLLHNFPSPFFFLPLLLLVIFAAFWEMTLSAKGKTSNESWVGLGGQLLVLFLHDDNNGSNGSTDSYLQTKLRRSLSSSATIRSRAQSTISICALLFFLTLLLFALSVSDPSPSSKARHLNISPFTVKGGTRSGSSFALQGMGTLFRRGNRVMTELLVAHLSEDTHPDYLRLFLRTLHRSGVTAEADIVFVFPQLSSQLKKVILQENEYFSKLLTSNSSSQGNRPELLPFYSTLPRNKPNGQPLWGRGGGRAVESNELSWGSVVGFESAELDPEDTLAGFLDKVPMQLRRWACYRMLLGRVRRDFKHVILVKVKDVLVIGDAFGRIRNRKFTDTVWIADHVIVGGMRPVRQISDVMLTEIVRVCMQRKSRTPHHDSQILSQLVKNRSSLSKKVKLTVSTELIPPNSVIPFSSHRRLSANIQQIICSSSIDRSVYRYCR